MVSPKRKTPARPVKAYTTHYNTRLAGQLRRGRTLMESDRPDLVRMREITVSTTNELNLIQNEISSLERLDLRARLAYPQYNQKLGSLKSRRITVRNRLSNLQQLKSSIVIDNYNNFDGGGPLLLPLLVVLFLPNALKIYLQFLGIQHPSTLEPV